MRHPLLAMALGMVALTGCTSVHEEFIAQDPSQVWTAMVAVAETPDYDDPDPTKRWTIKENYVWVDEETLRIEVYRELDRILHRAATKPLRQEQSWRFRITLDPLAPPRATFVSRGAAVPAKARAEAERYFEDVWEILRGMRDLEPDDVGVAPESPPSTAPDEDEPMIDIEELEPGGG
jgi:hypothetical protein